MNFRNIKGIVCLVLIPIALITLSLQSCEDISAPEQTLNTDNPDNPPDNDDDTDTIPPARSYIGVEDEDFFVQQDNSMCGPASFYMIFKYYGDPESGATLSTTGECLEDTILTGINEIFSIILDTSWISDWLDSVVDGIDCSNFYKKVSSLSRCTGNIGIPFYTSVDGNCDDNQRGA